MELSKLNSLHLSSPSPAKYTCIKPYEYVSQHPTIPAFLVGGCSSVVLRVGCIVSNIGHHVATEIWQIPGVKQQD